MIEKRSIAGCTIVHLLTFKVCLVSIHFTYLGVSKTNQMTCHPTFQLNECLAMHVLGLISQTMFEYDPSSTLSWAGFVLGPIFELCSSERQFKV